MSFQIIAGTDYCACDDGVSILPYKLSEQTTKGDDWTWNQIYEPKAPSTLKTFGNKKVKSAYDSEGRRIPSEITDEESSGMDGRSEAGHITLWNPEIAEAKEVLILAEVKSGKPTLTQVRAFCHTMNEQDAIGVFITIEPISQGMRQEAANMGTFYHNNQTFPHLQFWQIDDDYFENPARLSEIIRLPREWLKPTRRAERHSEDRQINMAL